MQGILGLVMVLGPGFSDEILEPQCRGLNNWNRVFGSFIV